jgi:hypothetical protein
VTQSNLENATTPNPLALATAQAKEILVLANSSKSLPPVFSTLPGDTTSWCTGTDEKTLCPASLNESGIGTKDLIIVTDCEASMLYEVLLRAKPLAEIAVIGQLRAIIENIDFYSTIHYKNLSLTFHPN